MDVSCCPLFGIARGRTRAPLIPVSALQKQTKMPMIQDTGFRSEEEHSLGGTLWSDWWWWWWQRS